MAVYWVERKWAGTTRTTSPRVVACDHWKTIRDNLRAIGLTLEALRAIKRAGASDLIERAFMGFNALPADAGAGTMTLARPWHVVLGISEGSSKMQVELAFRKQLQTKHPDHGGAHEQFLELNTAREAGLRQATS